MPLPRVLAPVPGWAERHAPEIHAVAAFLLVNLLLAVVMTFNGTGVFEQLSYVRFDSGHYTGIATGGYELFPCNPARYGPGRWCGNTAWFPGYPYLIRLLLPLTGGRPGLAGIVISKAFLLGTLLVFAGTLRSAFGARRLLPIVLAASLFPGAIYYHVVFPVSQFLFFSSLHLLLLLRRRDLLSGLCGAAAAMSYSSGYTLAAVSGIYLLLCYESFGVLVRRSLLVTGVTLLGVVAVLLIHQRAVGAWNAWFLVQAKYGFDPGHPFWSLWQILRPWGKSGQEAVIVSQNIAVFLLIAIAGGRLWATRGWDQASKLFFVYACVFFFAPVVLVGPRLGYYRTFSLLLPATALMARWPPALVSLFAAAFAVLFPLLSLMFFNSTIV